MVGAGFAAGAVASSSFVAAFLLALRAGPLERAAVTFDLRAGPLERVTAAFDFQAATLEAETCPASCPGPSLAFCAGPLLDQAELVIEAVRGYLPAFCFGFVCVVFGFVFGRCSAPEPVSPPPRRPYGSRLGETDVARRSAD